MRDRESAKKSNDDLIKLSIPGLEKDLQERDRLRKQNEADDD